MCVCVSCSVVSNSLQPHHLSMEYCSKNTKVGCHSLLQRIFLTQYQLVVIAHNGEGSATITSTEKVTFPNNKVTDTFYYYGDLIVTSEVQSYDLTLTRAVAMFRLVLTDDEIPSSVTKFKFYCRDPGAGAADPGELQIQKNRGRAGTKLGPDRTCP